MRLDPFFAERLREGRKQLLTSILVRIRQRLERWIVRWRSIFGAGPSSSSERDGSSSRPRAAASKKLPTPSQMRARHRRAAEAWDRNELAHVGTPGPEVRITEHRVDVPGYPSVRVRIYHPNGEGDGVVPGCLTVFGGAFRIGGIDYPTTDAANRRRTAEAGIAMVAVDYSLAPEHRFPTPVEQTYAALVWLFEHAEELGIDRDRIGIAGLSAGAGIAASVAIANRDRANLPVRLQLLEVPTTDLTGRHIDLRATFALGIPSLLVIRELRSVRRTYLADISQAHDPLASPLLAESHAGLPPAYIITAEYDPLRGDGEAYAAKLRAAGVDATAVRYLGATHDTWMYTRAVPSARRWHAETVSILSRLHESPQS